MKVWASRLGLLLFFIFGYVSHDVLTEKQNNRHPEFTTHSNAGNLIQTNCTPKLESKTLKTISTDKPDIKASAQAYSNASYDSNAAIINTKPVNLEASLKSDAPDPSEVLLKALKNSDDKIRERALLKSVDIGIVLPDEELIELLRSDPSDMVRQLAFRLITQSSNTDIAVIREMAELALNDVSDEIRRQARDLLDQMDDFKIDATPEQASSLPDFQQGDISMLNR